MGRKPQGPALPRAARRAPRGARLNPLVLALALALDRAPLGAPVATLVAEYGTPVAAASTDAGNRIDFRSGGATTTAWIDTDGAVLALDERGRAGDVAEIAIGGRERRLAFGRFTPAAADAELAAFAETSGDLTRTYRLDGERVLVLGFAAPAGPLERVVVGRRVALARLGLIPFLDGFPKGLDYTAPVLRRSPLADGAGPRAVVLRLAVDTGGAVTDAGIAIPSGDAAFDERAATLARASRYAAARLGGRAIGATVYREVRG